MSLAKQALLSVAAMAVVMGLFVFGPAGTTKYWQGWLYVGVMTAGSLVATIDLMRRDPALLERRMRAGPAAEKRGLQRVIMGAALLSFTATLVVPALDYRFGWSHVPAWLSILSAIVVVLGFVGIMRVFHENTYTAATIEVAEGQRVISTGPYAFVRHPMYASAFLYIAGTPLVLGSYWGLLAAAAMIAVVIWRLLDEERFLAANLPGYIEYQRKVRYRLVPFIW